MALFEQAYKKTLNHEGIYSDDSVDRGGETYKGISRKFHEYWEGWFIIDNHKNLPNFPNNLNNDKGLDELVKSFYKEFFWDKLKCDDISSQKVSEKLFDISVNQGIKTASKYFQESLNCLNNDNNKDIKVDGIIGKNTISKYNEFIDTKSYSSRSFTKNGDVLVKCLNGFQFQRYLDIVKRDSSQERFFYGWINRI